MLSFDGFILFCFICFKLWNWNVGYEAAFRTGFKRWGVVTVDLCKHANVNLISPFLGRENGLWMFTNFVWIIYLNLLKSLWSQVWRYGHLVSKCMALFLKIWCIYSFYCILELWKTRKAGKRYLKTEYTFLWMFCFEFPLYTGDSQLWLRLAEICKQHN